MLQDVKSYIGRCFAMKDPREAAYILGIKIYRDRLRRLIGASTHAEVKRMNIIPYASAVGSIMTKDMFLVYEGDIKRELRVSCYTDVGYLTDADDLKSQTRYVFVLKMEGDRHYRAKVHYLREVIEFSDVKIEKVHTDDNLADPFTKALPFPKHLVHTKNIGMLQASSLM
ncbi:hypothetical protein Tco_1346217 [Tanacetum coccineum]